MSDTDIDLRLRDYAARWRSSVDDSRHSSWEPPSQGPRRALFVTAAVLLLVGGVTAGVVALQRQSSTNVHTGASLRDATTTNTPAASNPRCDRRSLSVTPLGHGVAGGSSIWRFSVVNAGNSACTLARFGASVTGIALGHGADNQEVAFADGQRDPPQQLLTLSPGEGAELRLSSANFCDSSGQRLPSLRFVAVVVHLSEVDLRLDHLDLAVCADLGVAVNLDPAPVPPTVTLKAALPSSGLALGRAGAVVFFTNDGQQLFRLPGYSVSGYQPPIVRDGDGRRFLIRGGEPGTLVASDLEPRPPADYVAGQRCALFDQRDEIKLLTCWQPRLNATAPEIPPTLEVETGSSATSVAARTPPGMRGGHWKSSYLSPDHRWVAATWSAECETTTSWLLNITDGSQPTAVWPGSSSGALGWTPDGRAIFTVTAQPGCGIAGESPGVYTARPGGTPVQIISQQPNDSAVALWGAR